MAALLDTQAETRRVIYPDRTNNSGTASGAKLLAWMEEVGAMSAMRCAGSDVVVAGMDGVSFEAPIPQGHIALLEGYAYETGTSSVEVRVRGYAVEPATGDRESVTDAHMTLVAVDESGGARETPDLDVETDEGASLREAALESVERDA